MTFASGDAGRKSHVVICLRLLVEMKSQNWTRYVADLSNARSLNVQNLGGGHGQWGNHFALYLHTKMFSRALADKAAQLL